MPLQWFGQLYKDATIQALKEGIDRTSSSGTKIAKELVHKDLHILEGSIRPEPAQLVGEQVVGQYGTHDVDYAEPQESLPPSKGGKPYMRPSREEAQKELPVNLTKAWQKYVKIANAQIKQGG